MCCLGSIAYSVLAHQVYTTSPCGYEASTCADGDLGDAGFSTVNIGLYALPTIITAISEIFINVTAYGIAYTQSPKNMKGLVASINLFMQAIASIISLATAAAIKDPYLVWVFMAPTVAGAVLTVIFWFTFRNIDKQEFVINTDFGDMKKDGDLSDDESDVNVRAAREKSLADPAPVAPTSAKVSEKRAGVDEQDHITRV